jgi:hypothetical protein
VLPTPEPYLISHTTTKAQPDTWAGNEQAIGSERIRTVKIPATRGKGNQRKEWVTRFIDDMVITF